jgi:hypothetical protein
MNSKKLKRILSISKTHYFFKWVDVRADDECWPWVGSRDKDGYGIFGSNRAHRFCAEMLDIVSEREVTRHSCDNPGCCNPFHLLGGTQIENVRDRGDRGRSAAKERNGRAKLNTDQVIEIKASDDSMRALAARFAVNLSTIRDIKNGRIWRSVR